LHASADEQGCLFCHEGIEPFSDGGMMAAIQAAAKPFRDPGGCVICHGGTPSSTVFEVAHAGSPPRLAEGGGADAFYPDPGSIWIADKTCGLCHQGYPERLKKALMTTEAGKLQGNFWTWGLQEELGYEAHWGNYDIEDADGPTPAIGTDAYKAYMTDLAKSHPDQFPTELVQVPEVDVEQIPDHPNLAGMTYSRQQCQRCHTGVTGHQRRGDFRGAGCSSCHVPYGIEGFYEGGDPKIDKTEPGHPLVHRMIGSRKTKTTHNGVRFSGIPSETCRTCHNRGKRIGTSYPGMMEFPYGSPYDPQGETQERLHGRPGYLYIKDDLHHQIASRPGNPEGGLLCQDCHTSIDMHGDGNIFGTTLAQVEVECSDCHGTVASYPWELPLGYGEEFDQALEDEPRGLTQELPSFMELATVYEPRDGYLLTARGNPFGNVIKDGDRVILHSASGLDFAVPVLKEIDKTGTWRDESALVAKKAVGKHMESMECYACHSDWAPQCYGCHVTVDYSEGKTDVDWILNVNAPQADGLTPDGKLGTNGLTSPGKVSETRSYLRWETPILGINGEGRVSPLMPGCQVITTVIDKDGNTVAHNVMWNSPEGPIDHSAVQPHTAGRVARTCESCHANPKALGYGIEDGRFMQGYDQGFSADLATAEGALISSNARLQSQPIPGLTWDLSQIVTRDNEQLVSVGSHWPLTGPLPEEMRAKVERTGLCLGCHQEALNEDLWSKVSKPGFLENEAHQAIMGEALRSYSSGGSKGLE
jgi:hypothetical protein